MPRKPKKEKHQITVVVHGQPISVILHPSKGARKCWYAYWKGLVSSKSTGECHLEAATAVAEHMVRNGGRRGQLADAILSDEEFEEIQRRRFGKKKDPAARERAEKSLYSCLNAISAFRRISELKPVTLATPDDCELFQENALECPRNWRHDYKNGQVDGERCITPNTVIKWSRTLQAAFERVNRNAGKKCVRGVVDEKRLLTSNPWSQFTWIDGTTKEKRRFDDGELLAILDYFGSGWPRMTAVLAFVKVSLWIWARRSEVAGLRWDDLRVVSGEHHFDFVGKWGVRKWARIPVGLHQELLQIKTASTYVFGAHNDQLRAHYKQGAKAHIAKIVGAQYKADALCNWFHKRIVEWSQAEGGQHATHHAFRRTALQGVRRGEDRNERSAQDAKVSRSVMMQHYIDETEEELRQASNRAYRRILAGLRPAVAERYGYRADSSAAELEEHMRGAVNTGDWELAKRLAERLSRQHGRQA